MPAGNNIAADVEAVKRAADAQARFSQPRSTRGETRPATDLPADPLPGEVCTCPSLADLDPECPTHGGEPFRRATEDMAAKIAAAPLFTHTEGAGLVDPQRCTCPGDPSASAAGWNPSCPQHGESEVVKAYGKTTDELAAEAEAGYPIHPAWFDPNHPDAPRYVTAEIGEAAAPSGRHSADEELTTGHYAAAVAQEAIKLFTGPRNSDYGDATDNFTDIADLWSVVLRPILQPGKTITAEQVAIMSALIKVARLNNTPDHDDSWTDATAYLALGAGINRRRK